MAVRKSFGLVLILGGIVALLWGGATLGQASPPAATLIVDMLFGASIGGALVGSGVRMARSKPARAQAAERTRS